jgi:hypothetical protein
MGVLLQMTIMIIQEQHSRSTRCMTSGHIIDTVTNLTSYQFPEDKENFTGNAKENLP